MVSLTEVSMQAISKVKSGGTRKTTACGADAMGLHAVPMLPLLLSLRAY